MTNPTPGGALGPDRRPFLLCVGGPGSSPAGVALGPGAEFEFDGAVVSAMPPRGDLEHELAALLAERDALLRAAGRAELQQELAAAGVDTARARYDAAVSLCKTATTAAAAARRALCRHDAAITEVRAELVRLPSA